MDYLNRMSFLQNITWRRAVKSFQAPTNEEEKLNITPILNAACEAPSSFGLQPMQIIVVSDQEVKKELRKHSYQQPQVEECTHLLVFCARTDFHERIADYVSRAGISVEFANTMTHMIESQSHPTHWAKHQVYLSLGFALAAAAECKIASCPMEGFDPQAYSQVLDLSPTIVPTVILAIGWENKQAQVYPRFRFPSSDLVKYATVVSVAKPKTKYRNVTPVRKRRDADDDKN